MIVIVKQDNSLPDIFKNTGLQAVQHSVGRVVKTAPVQQEGRQAVSADGVIQQAVNRFPRPEQKHAVHGHDDQDPKDHIAVLRPVFLGDAAHFTDQQDHDHNHQRIGEQEVYDVKRPHLIAILRNEGISRDIMDGNLIKGIDGKYHDLKGSIQDAQAKERVSCLRKFAFREIHRKYKQAEQHDIDGDKVDAGHHGHAQIIVVQDTDQVADIYHGCPCAGMAQEAACGLIFLKGLDSQNRID